MVVKQWISAKLSEGQLKTLGRFKNRTIPRLRHRLGIAPFALVGIAIKLLPDKSLVSIKSGINVAKRMDYAGRDIFLAVDSEFEYMARLTSARREPETINWIESHMQAEDVLYDVGANVGAYSLVASKFHGPRFKVFAFEPAFQNFAQLCKNLAINGCQAEIVPLQVALSHETTIGSFNYRSLTPGTAIHSLGEPVDQDGDRFMPVAVQPVMSYRLDDLIQHLGLPVPNHIKIDVDGIEFSVIKGMSDTLADARVRTLMMEVNEAVADGPKIIEYLSGKGLEQHASYGRNRLFLRET